MNVQSVQCLISPDVVDGHVKDVNFPQLFTFPVCRGWRGDFLPEFVKAGVDLSLSLPLSGVCLLPPVSRHSCAPQPGLGPPLLGPGVPAPDILQLLDLSEFVFTLGVRWCVLGCHHCVWLHVHCVSVCWRLSVSPRPDTVLPPTWPHSAPAAANHEMSGRGPGDTTRAVPRVNRPSRANVGQTRTLFGRYDLRAVTTPVSAHAQPTLSVWWSHARLDQAGLGGGHLNMKLGGQMMDFHCPIKVLSCQADEINSN